MPLQTTINYDNPDNFDFTAGKIDFTNGAIFSGNIPQNRLFCAKFFDDFNAVIETPNSGISTITPATYGSPIIQNNRLYSDGNYNSVKFTDDNLKNNLLTKGTFRFLYIPDYDNYISAYPVCLFDLRDSQNLSSGNNVINLYHWNNGRLLFYLFDEAGNENVLNIVWSATKNREYLFELVFNSQADVILFIDGVELGRKTINMTRTATTDLLTINGRGDDLYKSSGYIRDFVIFTEKKHTSAFTITQSILDEAKYYQLSQAQLNKTADYSFLVNFKNHSQNQLDADFAEGNEQIINFNEASILNGQLSLTALGYVEYDAVNNFVSLDQFTIRLSIMPDYNGYPSSDTYFFHIIGNGYHSGMYLRHYTNGQLYLIYFNEDGHYQSIYLGVNNFTAGELYHIEINFNNNNRMAWTYINGEQKAITNYQYNPFTQVSLLTKIILGTSQYNSNGESFSIGYFHIIKQISHDNSVSSFSDYDHTNTMPFPIQTAYCVQPKTKLLTDGLENVSGEVIDTSDGDRRYIVIRDNYMLYYDGNNWTISDGSWSQSNDPLTMIQNLDSLDLTAGYNCTFRTLLYSNEGKQTDALQSITIDYNFYGGDATETDVCNVFGNVYDIADQPFSDIIIKVSLIDTAIVDKKIIPAIQKQIQTNQFGYFEIPLIPNSKLSPNSKYLFQFIKGSYKFEQYKIVPDTQSKNYTELQNAS